MPNKFLQPSDKGFRNPLDLNQENGFIVNPPRMNQQGGLDKIKEPKGPFKNSFMIKKPGSTNR